MERSSQYTLFSSKKQPANARSERKQFTENASVALQQTMLTHAHTKCPPVHVQGLVRRGLRFIVLIRKTRKLNRLQMLLQRQHFLLS